MKATDQLLKDHKLIRKILSDFSVENPRFPQLLKTLQRAVIGHAWFEDQIFLPAFEAEPGLDPRFSKEITQEHKDIEHLLNVMRKTSVENKRGLELPMIQLRALLDSHFLKEEEGLFPSAERILDGEGLNNLGDEMERRKMEIRGVVGTL